MGILSKFFGGSGGHKTNDSMSQQDAVEIIQQFGTVLEHQSPAPGCVADESKLPYTKLQIKEALVIGIKATPDPQMKELLKASYVQLADWQEGVGDLDIGIDLVNADLDADITELAESIVSQGASQEKWTPIVMAEQESLRQELVDFGV